MAELSDGWKQLAGRAEALGLKLKLHLEQEAADGNDGTDADESSESGSTKGLLDDMAKKLQDAFDSIGAAAKDPAVREDVKDLGNLFKDAVTETFSSVSSEVGETMKRATDRSSSDDGSSAGEASDDSTSDASPEDGETNG